MSDRDANTPLSAEDVRELRRQREMAKMPEWARARTNTAPDSEIKRWIAELRERLITKRDRRKHGEEL